MPCCSRWANMGRYLSRPGTGRARVHRCCRVRLRFWWWESSARRPALRQEELVFVMQPAASCFRTCGVNGGLPFLDVLDLAFLINNERRPVGNADLRHQDAIISGYLT